MTGDFRTLIGARGAKSSALHTPIALLLAADITNAHPEARQGRSMVGERLVNRIDIETMVFRVPRTDPVATTVAPGLVHHPGYSVHAERETIVREKLSSD
jgi:hypothetical protein